MLGRMLDNPQLYGHNARIPIAGDGDTRVAQTIGAMRAMAEDAAAGDIAQQLAARLAATRPQGDRRGQLEAIYDFLYDRIRFKRDTFDAEHLRHPNQVLSEAAAGVTAADCDDLAMSGAALALAMGFPVAYVTDALGRGDFAHVYLAAQLGGEWLPLDPQHRVPFGRWPKAGRRKLWELSGRRIGPMSPEATMYNQVRRWLDHNRRTPHHGNRDQNARAGRPGRRGPQHLDGRGTVFLPP